MGRAKAMDLVKKQEQFKVKNDCFAYDEKHGMQGKCTALNALYCKTEDCKFYKTAAQVAEEEERTRKRLRGDLNE